MSHSNATPKPARACSSGADPVREEHAQVGHRRQRAVPRRQVLDRMRRDEGERPHAAVTRWAGRARKLPPASSSRGTASGARRGSSWNRTYPASVEARREPGAASAAAGHVRGVVFEHDRRTQSLERPARAAEHRQLPSLDVNLDERQALDPALRHERVERDALHGRVGASARGRHSRQAAGAVPHLAGLRRLESGCADPIGQGARIDGDLRRAVGVDRRHAAARACCRSARTRTRGRPDRRCWPSGARAIRRSRRHRRPLVPARASA